MISANYSNNSEKARRRRENFVFLKISIAIYKGGNGPSQSKKNGNFAEMQRTPPLVKDRIDSKGGVLCGNYP